MWDAFIKIFDYEITPNDCYVLYCLSQKIKTPLVKTDQAMANLFHKGYIDIKQESGKNIVSITDKGVSLIEDLDSAFNKKKLKANSTIMGKDYSTNIAIYREIFPAGKLPSGKPARTNIKALTDSFKWFFDSYDYTWEEVIKATKMYVAEYKQKNYLYMMTSQYFISKQDKNKVKRSELADYCDMIRDGVSTVDHHFKEKVV